MLALAAYACFVEPHWIRVRQTPIRIASVPYSWRIVHLTDLHLSPAVSLDYLEGAFRQAIAQRPDLICITGDFFTDRLEGREAYAATLRILSRAAPTFACPGNHDGGKWAHARGGPSDPAELRGLLKEAGIRLLENEDTILTLPAGRILIGGLGDIWAERCDPGLIRADFDSSSAPLKILMTHNPDSKSRAAAIRWDLLLAGHTHGGQFSLPFVGTPLAPVGDKRFVNGLYSYTGRPFYVSPGVGNLHGVRFNCRPEISVLDLSR
ncbi:MAG: phosphodiesterase YaeI [Fibrobacteres bacterium]|nr:phosphodiesterase YaeI [Fibrobacterota bacterium]